MGLWTVDPSIFCTYAQHKKTTHGPVYHALYQGCTYTTICLYYRYTIILAIRSAVLMPIQIFTAGYINLYDINHIIISSSNYCIPYVPGQVCACLPLAKLDLSLWFVWLEAWVDMANRSSAVWRYFNIGATDESKAICKICGKAVSGRR